MNDIKTDELEEIVGGACSSFFGTVSRAEEVVGLAVGSIALAAGAPAATAGLVTVVAGTAAMGLFTAIASIAK